MARSKKPAPREHQFGLPLSGFRWEPSTPRTGDSITFEELQRWARIKKNLKFGPKLKRKLLAEFLGDLIRGE